MALLLLIWLLVIMVFNFVFMINDIHILFIFVIISKHLALVWVIISGAWFLKMTIIMTKLAHRPVAILTSCIRSTIITRGMRPACSFGIHFLRRFHNLIVFLINHFLIWLQFSFNADIHHWGLIGEQIPSTLWAISIFCLFSILSRCTCTSFKSRQVTFCDSTS